MKYSIVGCIILLMVSCENLSNPPLCGKWQLKTVEKNGEILSVDTVWYNFQSKSLFSVQIYDIPWDTFVGVRTQEDNLLSIQIFNNRFNKDIVDYTDWKSPIRLFTIEKVNRQRLLLRSEEGYLYSFIRF